MTTYGYIRVSSRDQNEDRQLIAMHNYGIDDKHIILDKQSGKDFNRPGYQKLLRRLRPGDCLVFQSIDRMGRNYDDILEQWRIITREKRSDIVILDMPLLDTRVRDRDFTGALHPLLRRADRARIHQPPPSRRHRRCQSPRRAFWPSAQGAAR